MMVIKQFVEKEFLPVVFGNDINAYSLAREFYEAYGIRTIVYGKNSSGLCNDSKLIEYHARGRLDQKEVFVSVVQEIAAAHPGKKILLLGCGDNYVEQIIRNRASYGKNVIVPYVAKDLMEQLLTKERFYEMCELHGLDYPKTCECTGVLSTEFQLDFSFPVVLKPSNGVSYWEHSFEGQKKVYRIETMEVLKRTVAQIYSAGYDDSMIIQEFIPGKDSNLRIVIGFSGKDGKVQLMSMANVVMEEHSPIRIGNAAALVTETNPELTQKLIRFLEGVSFQGFSTFDLKYDVRDGKYKVFEVNLRQGRSHYYVTGTGHNVAKYVVDEYVYGKSTAITIVDKELLWTAIPDRLLRKHLEDGVLGEKVQRLLQQNKVVRPLFLKGDNRLKRMAYLCRYQMSHYASFKKYYHGEL